MINWLFPKKKEILTEKQKFYIAEENNGWFTETEIYDSFYFEIPKGQMKISEKVIYFNLEILTGLSFIKLPGDPQSLYWYFCELWKTKKKDVKLFLESEFGFNFPFIFKKIKIPYAGLLFALDNSAEYEVVNKPSNHINTILTVHDIIKSTIDFDKHHINKEKFFSAVKFYLEINDISEYYCLDLDGF